MTGYGNNDDAIIRASIVKWRLNHSNPRLARQFLDVIIFQSDFLIKKYILRLKQSNDNLPIEYHDLYNAGILGLYEAVKRFDLNLTSLFTTYAFFWVKKYMYLALKEASSTPISPFNVEKDIKNFIILKEAGATYAQIQETLDLSDSQFLCLVHYYNMSIGVLSFEGLTISGQTVFNHSPQDVHESSYIKDQSTEYVQAALDCRLDLEALKQTFIFLLEERYPLGLELLLAMYFSPEAPLALCKAAKIIGITRGIAENQHRLATDFLKQKGVLPGA